MKFYRYSIINLLLSSLVCSCSSQGIHYPSKDYVIEMTYNDQFLICQLGDVHLSRASYLQRDFDYIEKAIKSYSVAKEIPYEMGKPNLLILNGDTFMNATKDVVVQAFDFFDSLNIPYAFTYGNHDLQGNYAPNFIKEELKKSKNSIFVDLDNDDVFGNSNYVIDLKHMDKSMFQIYIMDSNSFIFSGYDTFHDDQIEWYERMVNHFKDLNGGVVSPSLAFFHIPTLEFELAIDEFGAKMNEVKKDEFNYCLYKESVSYANENSELVNKMFELNSTIGIGVSHDHVNSCDLWYYGNYDHPIRLIYGNKATDNIYYDEEMMGATFYTLNETMPTLDAATNKKSYFTLTKVLSRYDDDEVVIEWEK